MFLQNTILKTVITIQDILITTHCNKRKFGGYLDILFALTGTKQFGHRLIDFGCM